MSLLTACQQALREIGYSEIPTTIINNQNPTAQLVLGKARRAGYVISRKVAWTSMQASHTFVTQDGVDKYDFPAGFGYPINQTEWNQTNYWRNRGPASPQIWERLKSGIVVLAQRNWYRTNQNQIQIYPAGTSTPLTMIYQWVTKNWIDTNGDGIPDALAFQGDSDEVVFDEDLFIMHIVWRVKKQHGEDYAEEYNEAMRELEKWAGQDGGAPILNMEYPTLVTPDVVNLPDGSWNV